MKGKHFLLLSLPVQSHINPTLQLAKILAHSGARVTFATTANGLASFKSHPTIDNLSFDSFYDGNEPNNISEDYIANLKRLGPQSLSKLLQNLSNGDSPVTFIVYGALIPWVAEVAREVHIPSAYLFIQCATAFTIIHRFLNREDGLLDNFIHDINNPDFSIKLPGLPLFTSLDIPTFLLPENELHAFVVPNFREQIQTLEKDPNPCVLVNTFDALEKDIIKSFPGMKLIAVGPLVPSAFSDGSNLHDKSFGVDLFQSSRDYLSWLDSKPDKSVIYVSFGSLAVLKETQKEEILHALMESGRPFLWIIRDINEEELKSIRGKNGISEEIGLIVPWCSQVEVLCHPAIGCFVTHCGWNSTVESIIAGVPLVGCPSFMEQKTNMKIVEEAWGNGVRVKENEEGVFGRDEIRRCLDVVTGEGEKGKEIRRNALKWKTLGVEAVKDGGSSYNNLKLFLEM